MNLDNLKALHAAATPEPWQRLPILFSPQGGAALSRSNGELLLVLRNIVQEILEVLEHTSEMARLYNGVLRTLDEGATTAATDPALNAYSLGCQRVLMAQDRLIARMDLL